MAIKYVNGKWVTEEDDDKEQLWNMKDGKLSYSGEPVSARVEQQPTNLIAEEKPEEEKVGFFKKVGNFVKDITLGKRKEGDKRTDWERFQEEFIGFESKGGKANREEIQQYYDNLKTGKEKIDTLQEAQDLAKVKAYETLKNRLDQISEVQESSKYEYTKVDKYPSKEDSPEVAEYIKKHPFTTIGKLRELFPEYGGYIYKKREKGVEEWSVVSEEEYNEYMKTSIDDENTADLYTAIKMLDKELGMTYVSKGFLPEALQNIDIGFAKGNAFNEDGSTIATPVISTTGLENGKKATEKLKEKGWDALTEKEQAQAMVGYVAQLHEQGEVDKSLMDKVLGLQGTSLGWGSAMATSAVLSGGGVPDPTSVSTGLLKTLEVAGVQAVRAMNLAPHYTSEIDKKYLDLTTPEYAYFVDKTGDIILEKLQDARYSEEEQGFGIVSEDNKAMQMAKLSNFLEVYSESWGQVLGTGGEEFMNSLIKTKVFGSFANWMRKTGKLAQGTLYGLLKQAKFDGVVGEFLEEELLNPLQSAIERTEYQGIDTKEGRERMLIEILGFGATQSGAMIQGYVQNKDKQKSIDYINNNKEKFGLAEDKALDKEGNLYDVDSGEIIVPKEEVMKEPESVFGGVEIDKEEEMLKADIAQVEQGLEAEPVQEVKIEEGEVKTDYSQDAQVQEVLRDIGAVLDLGAKRKRVTQDKEGDVTISVDGTIIPEFIPEELRSRKYVQKAYDAFLKNEVPQEGTKAWQVYQAILEESEGREGLEMQEPVVKMVESKIGKEQAKKEVSDAVGFKVTPLKESELVDGTQVAFHKVSKGKIVGLEKERYVIKDYYKDMGKVLLNDSKGRELWTTPNSIELYPEQEGKRVTAKEVRKMNEEYSKKQESRKQLEEEFKALSDKAYKAQNEYMQKAPVELWKATEGEYLTEEEQQRMQEIGNLLERMDYEERGLMSTEDIKKLVSVKRDLRKLGVEFDPNASLGELEDLYLSEVLPFRQRELKVLEDKFLDKLTVNRMKEFSKEWFGDENVEVVKNILRNKKALGMYLNRLIEIKSGQAHVGSTFYHEAVHKAFDIFLTADEKKAMIKEVVKRVGKNKLLEEWSNKDTKEKYRLGSYISNAIDEFVSNMDFVEGKTYLGIENIVKNKENLKNKEQLLIEYANRYDIRPENLWGSVVEITNINTKEKKIYLVDGKIDAIHAQSLIDGSNIGLTEPVNGNYYHIRRLDESQLGVYSAIEGKFDPSTLPYSKNASRRSKQREYRLQFGIAKTGNGKFREEVISNMGVELMAEEWLAENIIDYVNNRNSTTFWGKLKRMVDVFVDRMFRGIDHIKDIEDFYESLISGRLLDRQQKIEAKRAKNYVDYTDAIKSDVYSLKYRLMSVSDEVAKIISSFKSLRDFKKDFMVLYHGGQAEIIGEKLSTGGKVAGTISAETLGKGQDMGGIFFTPEKDFASIFTRWSEAGAGKVHNFLVETKNMFDVRNPEHYQMLKDFVGRKYKDVDGEELVFTEQLLNFMVNDGVMDWATFDIGVIQSLGFNGAVVTENSDYDGKSLMTYVLFDGGKDSRHWLLPDEIDNIVDLYKHKGILNGEFDERKYRSGELIDYGKVAQSQTLNTKEDPLITEARKYDSAEEFVRHYINNKNSNFPNILYHGSNESFEEFEKKKGKRNYGIFGEEEVEANGFFFTTNKEYAKEYGKNVITAYVRVNNPLIGTKEAQYGELTGQRLKDANYIFAPSVEWDDYVDTNGIKKESAQVGTDVVVYEQDYTGHKLPDNWLSRFIGEDGGIDWRLIDNPEVSTRLL